MMTIGVVLELGEPLGYMRYAQRCELQKRIERLGGRIKSVVDDSVRLVVSRNVGKDEFDTSLVLQQALKGNIPIVTTSFVAYAEQQAAGGLEDAVSQRAVVDKHLIRIPPQCIEALTAAMQFTTLETVATVVVVDDYQEQVAIEHLKDGMTAPTGWPAWTLTQLEAYDVVRESMCRDGSSKVELHCGINSSGGGATTSAQLRAPSQLPFRIMVSEAGAPVGHGTAIFLSDAAFANRRFALEVRNHGGHDATRPPARSYGSVRSCAIPMDVAQLAAQHLNAPLDPATEQLVRRLFTASWRQLSGITAFTAHAAGENALIGKTLMDVAKAEAILQCIGTLLASDAVPRPVARLRELSALYFNIVPRGSWLPDEAIATPQALELACDATRCMRAMLSTGEACCGNIYNAPPYVQLASLQTIVRPVDASSPAFRQVLQLIEGSRPSARHTSGAAGEPPQPQIVNLFAVRNEASLQAFRSASKHLDNHRLLLHGTPCGNAVPILGQGLQVPLVARLRRDAGMLGRGIYFGDSIHTALQYCGAPSPDGTFFVFASLVALGRVCEVRHHRKDLTHAPEGYDSVHGTRSDDPTQGDFSEDEFVVYHANQTTVEFLVEVKCAGVAAAAPAVPSVALPAPQAYTPPPASASRQGPAAEFVAPTVKPVESGLRTAAGQPVPLCNTRFRARIVDLIAEVDVLQQYRNHSDSMLETKYVFPLQSGCAVCAFEAYINDKKIVGCVKEKEEARREYKAAVERGDGAYLMDESEETPDVFTVSVGNLPPMTDVVIRITYLLELRVHPALQAVEFIIPSGLVPVTGRVDAMRKPTQTQTHTQWADALSADGTVGVEVSLDMPFDILRVECSHAKVLRRKRSACRAVLKADAVDLASRDFVLYAQIASITTPRIWIEAHPSKPSRAAMITFFPELPDPNVDRTTVGPKEVLLVLDCSASMRDGSAMLAAKQAAVLFLRALPRTWCVNVVLFGCSYVYLFPKSRKASVAVVEAAVDYVQSVAGPWLGGSCLGTLLPALGRFACLSDTTLDVVLVSDGLMTDGDRRLFQTLEELPALRVFPVVVGKASNPTLMRSMGIAGRGQTEVLSDATKSRWVASIDAQVRRIGQDALSSIRVDWCTEESRRLRNATNATVVQSPRHVATLFRNESTVVYGIIKHNAVQCELTASQCGKLVERDAYDCWPSQNFLVTATSTSFVSGTIVHRLCAKARIREYTDGLLSLEGTVAHEAQRDLTKAAIVSMGCEHGLVTPFTSMVAVEERTSEERAGRAATGKQATPRIDDVGPSVDILPEEPFEDVLNSDDDGAAFSSFSVVSRRHKKQLREDKRRRAEARQRRIDDDWVRVADQHPCSSEPDPVALLRTTATDVDDELSDGSDVDMGQRDASSRILFHYEAPEAETEAEEELDASSSSSASSADSDADSFSDPDDHKMCMEWSDYGDVAECSSDSGSFRDLPVKDALPAPTLEPAARECGDAPTAKGMAFGAASGSRGGSNRRGRLLDTREEEDSDDDDENGWCVSKALSQQLWGDATTTVPALQEQQQQPSAPSNINTCAAEAKKKKSVQRQSPKAEVPKALPMEQAQPPTLSRTLASTVAPKPCPPPPHAPPPKAATSEPLLSGAGPQGAGGGGMDLGFGGPASATKARLSSAVPLGGVRIHKRAAAAHESRPTEPAAAAPPPPPPPCAPQPSSIPPETYASFSMPSAAARSVQPTGPAPRMVAPGGPPVQRRVQSGLTGASMDTCMQAAAPVAITTSSSKTVTRGDDVRAAREEVQRKVPQAVGALKMAARQGEAVKGCMQSSIEGVLDRGESLDDLVCRSEALASHASRFKSASTKNALSGARRAAGGEEKEREERSRDRGRASRLRAESGAVRDTEFSVAMGGDNSEGNDRECIAEALRLVSDRDGYVSADRLRHVMTNLGEKIDAVELDEMLDAFGFSSGGSEHDVHYTELVEQFADEGPPQWSEGALRLEMLPSHFGTAMLPPGIRREQVQRCPATGMCLGSAVVDYGVGSSSASSEAVMQSIVYVIVLCEVHGWSWGLLNAPQQGMTNAEMRKALIEELHTQQQKEIADASAKAAALSTSTASPTSAIEALCGALDALFGLPSGGVWALLCMQTPLGGAGERKDWDEHVSCAEQLTRLHEFLEALERIVDPRRSANNSSCTPLPQLEANLKRYSNTYYPPWDAFVPLPMGLPAGAASPQPFPFSVVEPSARNYYHSTPPP